MRTEKMQKRRVVLRTKNAFQENCNA